MRDFLLYSLEESKRMHVLVGRSSWKFSTLDDDCKLDSYTLAPLNLAGVGSLDYSCPSDIMKLTGF